MAHRVTIRRVYEVYCPKHGVLDEPRRWKDAKDARRRHYEDYPECAVPVPRKKESEQWT